MLPPEQVLDKVDATQAYQRIEQLQKQGRGILYLTPHLGCFEVSARVAAQRGPITVLYRPAKRQSVQTMIEASRKQPNLDIAPTNASGVRKLLRALKRGEAVGMLPDQVPSDGEGVWAPFFGRPAYTMTLPIRLAKATGACIVMAAGERLPDGRGWRVLVEPCDIVWSDDDTQAAAQMNQALEQFILRWPEQYLWGYNRYKVPRHAKAAGAAEPHGEKTESGASDRSQS